MASILRPSSFLRIFNGCKHSLASSYSCFEVTRIQKLQIPSFNLSIARSFAAQRTLENVDLTIDKVLYRIDGEIRRTGRLTRRDIDDIIGELKLLKYASSTQGLLLISCCGNLIPEELPEVRNKFVQNIWDTLLKFGIPLDIGHYNALLKVYLENEHKFLPMEFLSNLEHNGIEPNRVTYQRLISRYCHEGDIDGASKILEFMKEKGLSVNECVFNALIMGHARADDMKSAREVIGLMQGAGLDPSEETYMMLMVAYAEKGDIDGLNSVLKECETADIQLFNREYMEVIFALAAKGYSHHVPQFIEKLQKIFGYVQDTMTLIFRLLNVGCDEIAYQMFKTMPIPQNAEGYVTPVGVFFIKHLIKAEMYSVTTVIKYCQRMKSEGLNLYAMERALYFALKLERPQLAMAISRVMLEDGAPIRPHYFWPIFVHYGNQGEKEMIYNTVREMFSMDVQITLETSRDYLFPALVEKDEEPVIVGLNECGMKVSVIITGYVAYYLNKDNLVAASQLLEKYRFKLPAALRRDLAAVYVRTQRATEAAAILGQIIKNYQKKDDEDEVENTEESQERYTGTEQDVAASFLKYVLYFSRHLKVALVLEPMLKAMESRSINISNDHARLLKERLGEHLTEELGNLLDSLSSVDLVLQPLLQEAKPHERMDVEELERRLTECETKNAPPPYHLMNKLLGRHIRMRDIEKAEEIKQKMDSFECPLTDGSFALLIELYASEGQLEKALNLYEQLKTREPDIKLDDAKVFKLATAMIVEEQLEECIKLLEDNAPTNQVEKDVKILHSTFVRLLTSAKEKYDETVIHRLLDTVMDQNYGKPTKLTFEPLIRAYLKKDDIAGAVEAFEKIYVEHKLCVMKLELMTACIRLEDTQKLQKLMDLGIDMHGEMNSLFDLVFAFIECGKVKQAKKLLETPGLRAQQQKLEYYCTRLLDKNRITELEQLVTVTKDVFDLDRNMMFLHLLKAYKIQQDCDKAIGIWITMQDEGIKPSELFLWELGQMLTEQGHNIPFIMPQDPNRLVSPPPPVIESPRVKTTNLTKSYFNRALKEKNLK